MKSTYYLEGESKLFIFNYQEANKNSTYKANLNPKAICINPNPLDFRANENQNKI